MYLLYITSPFHITKSLYIKKDFRLNAIVNQNGNKKLDLGGGKTRIIDNRDVGGAI
jgi:hypothetical protein